MDNRGYVITKKIRSGSKALLTAAHSAAKGQSVHIFNYTQYICSLFTGISAADTTDKIYIFMCLYVFCLCTSLRSASSQRRKCNQRIVNVVRSPNVEGPLVIDSF